MANLSLWSMPHSRSVVLTSFDFIGANTDITYFMFRV